MSGFNSDELKYYALIFGVVLLLVYAYRKATKKVRKDQEAKAKMASEYSLPKRKEKPVMTGRLFPLLEEPSFLMLLAGAGNLYMHITIMSLLETDGLWVWWIDAFFPSPLRVLRFLLWRRKTKNWVFAYFMATLIPLFVFMSIQGTNFKISAMIHLFPLVLLYFVLKPVWGYLKTS
jgi:hypothetical protein